MSNTEDVTRVLFEWDCPCPLERDEMESNDGGRERRRSAEFKHDARRCPERFCTVQVIRLDIPYVPDLGRKPAQGALDLGEHPAPEVRARLMDLLNDPPMPLAAVRFMAKANKHGWRVTVYYARGTRVGRKLKVVDSYRVTCISPDDGTAVLAVWVDARFDMAYGVEFRKAKRLSAADASAWLTGGRPDDGANAAS